LAAAIGCSPGVLGVAFCRKVLMKRWRMDCNHLCRKASINGRQSDRWKTVGPVDPIKAILIQNV
jgi:hypothetical protein